MLDNLIGIFRRMEYTRRGTTNVDADERVIGHKVEAIRRCHGTVSNVAVVGTCHSTCCGCHDDSMTLDIGVLIAISMTGYASSNGRSLKLVLALYALIPVVVMNHQYIGFLLLPRGPVMTASIPSRGSSLRVIRIFLPTIFRSRA